MYESLIRNFLYYYLKKQRWKIFILIILIPLSPLTHTFWNTWHSCYYHNRSHICSEWSVFLGVGDVDTSSITSVFYWRGFNYKETLQPFFSPQLAPCYVRRINWSDWDVEEVTEKVYLSLFLSFWSYLSKVPAFRSAPYHVVNVLIHEGGLQVRIVAYAQWVIVMKRYEGDCGCISTCIL